MTYANSIFKIYFKVFFFLLPFISFGQNEAVIVGKILNPQTRTLAFRYRNNPLFYDENKFITTLDSGNNFIVKVKTKTSQTIYMDYQDKKFKFFLSPGDTLKINFDDKLSADHANLEGSAAANNIYLLKTNAVFTDWLDETVMANQRKKLSAVDYQIYVDSVYKIKRRFIDNYPITEINNFSTEFLDFTTQDIQYWRAYMIMKYYDDYHSAPDALRNIDDNYFGFLIEVQTSSAGALNNDYCLKFLSLYLNFLKDKYYSTSPLESAATERRVITQTVRPIAGNVRVLVDPFTSKEIVGWMAPYNKADFLNLKTDEKFRYIGKDTTFEDTFLKIKTEEGKEGWVPASSVILIENVTIVKNYIERHCFDTQSSLCGLERHLNGRVLYVAAAKEVLLNFLIDDKTESEKKLKAYSTVNSQFQSYNDFLNSAFIQTNDKRKSGATELGFTPICVLSDTQSEKNIPTTFVENLIEIKPKILSTYEGNDVIKPTFDVVSPPENIKQNLVTNLKKEKKDTVLTIPISAQGTLPNSVGLIPLSLSNLDANAAAKKNSENTKVVKDTATLKYNVPQIDKNKITPLVEKPETVRAKSILPVSPTTSTENKQPVKVNQIPVVDSKKVTTTPTIDYTVQNKKFFESDVIIDNAGLNLQQELVASNPNEKQQPIKMFEGLVLGEEAPKYKFVDVNGKEIASEELLGKVVFIEFWATWCGPCQAQMTHAQELAKNYKDRDDVVFVFISKDEDTSAWKSSLEMNKWNEGEHGNDPIILPLNFGVQFLPNSFIIDKKGKVSFNSLISKRNNVTDEKTIDALVKSQR